MTRRVLWLLVMIIATALTALDLSAVAEIDDKVVRDEVWRGGLCFGFIACLSGVGIWRRWGPLVLAPTIASLVSISLRTGDDPRVQLLFFCVIGIVVGVVVDAQVARNRARR